MNCLASPMRSATPVSRASRNILWSALNTTDRVVVVTMLAFPSGRLIPSDGSPSRFAVTLIGKEPAHVLAIEDAGILSRARCVDLQKDSQFHCCPADSVDNTAGDCSKAAR
jgi:hypothetical protein